MVFVSAKWNCAKDWEKGPFGCYQPVGDKFVDIQKIAVFLVPALAFDRKGRRLGRGYGFYDKALAHTGALKLGLAKSIQISESDLPEESHDIKMSVLLTEGFCLVPSYIKPRFRMGRVFKKPRKQWIRKIRGIKLILGVK